MYVYMCTYGGNNFKFYDPLMGELGVEAMTVEGEDHGLRFDSREDLLLGVTTAPPISYLWLIYGTAIVR